MDDRYRILLDLNDDHHIYKKCLGITHTNRRCNITIKINKYCPHHAYQEEKKKQLLLRENTEK